MRMAVVADGTTAHIPHVPDLMVLVGMARHAGAATDGEALDLVTAGLQLLAEQWSDGVRIRLVAAAPVDVARWLVPPRRPPRAERPGASLDELAAALAEMCGCSPATAREILAAILRALAEVLPEAASPHR